MEGREERGRERCGRRRERDGGKGEVEGRERCGGRRGGVKGVWRGCKLVVLKQHSVCFLNVESL